MPVEIGDQAEVSKAELRYIIVDYKVSGFTSRLIPPTDIPGGVLRLWASKMPRQPTHLGSRAKVTLDHFVMVRIHARQPIDTKALTKVFKAA